MSLLVLSSCWTYTLDTNGVVGGNGYYVYYYKHATDDLVDKVHYGGHKGDAGRTFVEMRKWVRDRTFNSKLRQVGLAISDFDYFLDPTNEEDFADAAWDAAFTNRCLVQHYSLSPWTDDRHNWTFREPDDGYCKWGKGYI